jgi:hypothetical protein
MFDDSMTEKAKITVIATGLDEETNAGRQPVFTQTKVPKTNFATKDGQVASSLQKNVSATAEHSAGAGAVPTPAQKAPAYNHQTVDNGEIKIPVFLQRKK